MSQKVKLNVVIPFFCFVVNSLVLFWNAEKITYVSSSYNVHNNFGTTKEI